jgi:hypothetical protein
VVTGSLPIGSNPPVSLSLLERVIGPERLRPLRSDRASRARRQREPRDVAPERRRPKRRFVSGGYRIWLHLDGKEVRVRAGVTLGHSGSSNEADAWGRSRNISETRVPGTGVLQNSPGREVLGARWLLHSARRELFGARVLHVGVGFATLRLPCDLGATGGGGGEGAASMEPVVQQRGLELVRIMPSSSSAMASKIAGCKSITSTTPGKISASLDGK